jgi:hypothetical protein
MSQRHYGTSNAASLSSGIVGLFLLLHTGWDSAETHLPSIVVQQTFHPASRNRSGEAARLHCFEAHRLSTAIRLPEHEASLASSHSSIEAIAVLPSRSVLCVNHRIWG